MKQNKDGNAGQLRQGDLLFVKLEKGYDPNGRAGKLMQSRTNIIAAGEATGHNHTLQVEEGNVAQLFFNEQSIPVVRVESGEATVVHEEHETQVLDEGDWLVIRQVEYTPSAQRWRTVAD